MTLGALSNDAGKRYVGHIDALGFPHTQGKLYFLPPNHHRVQFQGQFQHGRKITGEEYDVNGTLVETNV